MGTFLVEHRKMLLSTEELRRAGAFEHGKTLEHGKIKLSTKKAPPYNAGRCFWYA